MAGWVTLDAYPLLMRFDEALMAEVAQVLEKAFMVVVEYGLSPRSQCYLTRASIMLLLTCPAVVIR